jgi:VWFA-related protein
MQSGPPKSALLVLALLSALHAAAQSTAPTIRVYSRETIVDVTVTDSRGNPVHGLTKNDFTVKEDGREEAIKSFEEFGTQTVQPLPKLPPNVYTNAQPPAASGALNILLLDFVNTAPTMAVSCCVICSAGRCGNISGAGPKELARALAVQHYAKEGAKKYIERMPVGTRVAVIGMSWPGSLRILQGFTSDAASLRAAVDTLNYDTYSEVATGGEVGMQVDRRARMTLESLQQIAASLAGIKGRKNLIWFTDGSPCITNPNGCPSHEDYSTGLARGYALLAAAQVTVYPVDARGVATMPDQFISFHGGLYPDVSSLAGAAHAEAEMAYRAQTAVEQLSMEAIAEATGGKAYYNSNDLADLTAKAINSGSDYYTLSYVPPGSEYDGRHHSIKIVANQPGLKLTYRDEYYAEDPHKIAPSPGLTFDATQILFRVHVTQTPASATLSPQNNPDPKQMHPPYRHLSIAYTIDVHGIDFTQKADNNYRGAFEYGVNVYNADGDVINSTANTVSPIVPPAVYQSMLRTGANAHRDIDIPATGDYFLRIAVHDLTSGRIGAIEIPTSSLTPAKSEKP